MGRHSSARRGATIYPPFRGGGSEPRPRTSRTARSKSADENGFLKLVAAPNSSAPLRRSSRPVESRPDMAITFTPGDSFRIRRTVTIVVLPRHEDVGDHEVGSALGEELQSGLTIARLEYLVPRPLQGES